MRNLFVPVCVSSVLVLSACASGGGGSSGGSTGASSSTTSNSATAPTSTLFNLPVDTKVSVASASASLNEDTGEVRSYEQDFWFKSPDANSEGPNRRLRYGKPFVQYHPHRNYTIPIEVTDAGGQRIGTGTATFSGDDVENGVTTRTINLTDHQLSNSIFGLFSTDDTGDRGNFFEIHAYAGGIAATNLPATATYTGTFIGDVISDVSSDNHVSSAARISLPTDLTVNFNAGAVIGTIGASDNPDMTLTGTVTDGSMTGSVTLNTGVTALAAGSAGTFSGGFFGDGAAEAAGTLGISDESGAVHHEMVGAFGATKN